MRLISFEELGPRKGVTYSRPHIWRREREGTFPRRVKLGGNRVAWIEDEIDAWVEARIAERDAEHLEADNATS